MDIAQVIDPLVRAIRWHRRKLAALAAVGCVAATLGALTPPAPPTLDIVVAGRPVEGGHSLVADDLDVVAMPTDLAPEGALTSRAALVGRVLAAPVPRGAPLTELSVVSARAGASKGELLVPVPLDDDRVLSLVQVGDRVTVVSAGQDGQVVTLARRVRVAGVTQGRDASGGVLLLACPDEVAARLAAWSTGGSLGIALG